MQCKVNPIRSSKSKLLLPNKSADYVDSLIKYANKLFKPFKANLGVFTRGNHENSLLEKLETDIIKRTVLTLNNKSEAEELTGKDEVQLGGYTGWIIYHFEQENGGGVRTFKQYYNHGFGGGGLVTMGLIDYARVMGQVQDADFIIMGHIHRSMYAPIQVQLVGNNYKIKNKTIHFMRSSTYKDEWQDGYNGWVVENNHGTRPLGGWWINFEWHPDYGILPSVELTKNRY